MHRLEITGDSLRHPAGVAHQELVGDDVRHLVLEHRQLLGRLLGAHHQNPLAESIGGDEAVDALGGELLQLGPRGQIDHLHVPRHRLRVVPGGGDQRGPHQLQLRGHLARLRLGQVGAEDEVLALQLDEGERIGRPRVARAGQGKAEQCGAAHAQTLPRPTRNTQDACVGNCARVSTALPY